MSNVDPDLIAMMDGVFAEQRENPAGDLWRRLDDLGLVRLTGPEASGGSGAGWFEAAELIGATVRHAVRVPLAEHDLLACWLLDSLDQPVDAGRRTVCLLDESRTARAVPWAAGADRIVVVWASDDGYRVADADAATLRITPGTNLIGEPRDTVAVIDALDGIPADAGVLEELQLRSALVRAIAVCAALDRMLELSVTHAGERIQFGRPLARFQAVQGLIADIAAEAALARAATNAALATAAAGACSEFLVAVARSCAGHATSVAVRNAHQVHGAIGTTREHTLHEYTRAALAWRSEYGSVRYWDEQVAGATRAAGSERLWSLIAD